VNVGLPRDVAWQGRTIHTAVWKAPVTGRRHVGRLDVDGDAQGDLQGHGGEQRAVLVYQLESYRYWERELGRGPWSPGQFGENFTVEGLPDDEVCIGDRLRIGGALFEVTQPRVTCFRVGVRMGEPRLPALLVAHRRPGFYLRVIQEGDVGAGDQIHLVARGPEEMTVAEIDALLYLPGHPRDALERALRIPALSIGWQESFRALLAQERAGGQLAGNSGLAPEVTAPAWKGFRAMRVARRVEESASILSLWLEAVDGSPLALPLPGQFVVVRLRPDPGAPPVLRSYSLSSLPGTDHYRVSVKRETNGIASGYIFDRVHPGDTLDVSAPRGSFTLRPGTGAVVLASAGVGATPVLAMLHALAASRSPRHVWWLFGARDGAEHPFASESRALLGALPSARTHVCYSRPAPTDRLGVDFDAPGRLTRSVLGELGVPRDADFYLCGPPGFLVELRAGLVSHGVEPGRIHTEIFGAGPSVTPGIAPVARVPPHPPAGPAGDGPVVTFVRSGFATRWSSSFQNVLELAEACDVPVRWSCRTGVCHTCESGLVAGAVRYEPEPVELPAPGAALICCARPEGDVALDL
jgi:ferredoxin-NADP reductase/MOSC domain-containing protein YiiM/ferredoxin